MRILNIGIDVGSTTIKTVVMKNGKIMWKTYRRHFSDIRNSFKNLVNEILETFEGYDFKAVISGSGGVSMAETMGIKFVQEVIASTAAVKEYLQNINTIIELGGEDAKITFMEKGIEQRMNGTCAGGTGAFIDQMASLLKCSVEELNNSAKEFKKIYPIAARCGVFAKSDIQPLINQGGATEDIAASIFQSVVNQTIAGLACGREIVAPVAFLGGPLTFLSQLGERFKETLKLNDEEAVFPQDGEYYVAMGAALKSEESNVVSRVELGEKIKLIDSFGGKEINILPPLFRRSEEIEEFKRENIIPIDRCNIQNYKGKIFLGIDAGSTTTKMVAIDDENRILFERYGSNEGKPLEKVKNFLGDLYQAKNKESEIAYSVVTGYGEELIQKAFGADEGIVETVAHYRGANYFYPGVTFILDIGGQDMKCMRIKDGVIEDIMLNEACSSGCGSFIQGFAEALHIPVEEFGVIGTKSKRPVDLGSRCTVFMNSRVKQAQKEGAEIGDISAGLAYSVIKNALFKVIKIKDIKEMGDKIILQGGTFYNDSVLKAFENVIGIPGKRPEICGLMGAFGAAIIAREKHSGAPSRLRSYHEIENFNIEKKFARCGLCQNNCALTVNIFDNGERMIIGNRCEKGAGKAKTEDNLPNLFEIKNEMLDRLEEKSNESGIKVGIPNALNMFENYPLWFHFFTKLGLKVIRSSKSSKEILEKGFQSIPSESVCYPAKLTHGHIQDLLDKEVDFIFYPSIVYEIKEHKGADNHYNCPIVTSYPEVINNNMSLKNKRVIAPFLNLNHDDSVIDNLNNALGFLNLGKKEIKRAYKEARKEYEAFYQEYRKVGMETLEDIRRGKYRGILVCGRPYHVDEEINHGIDRLINSLEFAVLTEESISNLGELKRPIRVVDQWMYHTRLYEAADIVGRTDGLEMIQLNSFGCGLDAVTTDMVEEIIRGYGKIYTMIKIDEISNLGAAKIRLRSLKYAIDNRVDSSRRSFDGQRRKIFTKEMSKDYTIIAPQMSPLHFKLLEIAFQSEGYNLKVLHDSSKDDVEEGLRYVNNDACYPSIITVGQIINAVKNGDLDSDKTAVIISQTGGGCRATNYIGFLRKALKDAGYENIPVISMSAGGLESNPGFKVSLKLIRKAIVALCFGDLFMKVLYRTRPYEVQKGSCDRLYESLNDECCSLIERGEINRFTEMIQKIIAEFDNIELSNIKKPKVGVVGEILVKYHPLANNNLVELIESEGGEAVVPGLLEFFLYCSYNTKFKKDFLGMSTLKKIGGDIAIKYIESYSNKINKYLKESRRFHENISIEELAHGAEKILSLGNMTGEGWFLTAEMVELIESGVWNIVCTQPFACLPNHVTGKGMIKVLKDTYPDSNIVAIDYDPGASEVNQLNRIKLMMTVALERIKAFNDDESEVAMTKNL